MRDISQAKALLSEQVKCAILKGEKTFLSGRIGVAPLMEIINSGEDYSGCIAADKIVGKAAALLYAKIGAVEIYASVLSKAAIGVLETYGIKYSYGTLVDFIRNRTGDGMCPLEMTVTEISDPTEAVAALRKTIAILMSKKG